MTYEIIDLFNETNISIEKEKLEKKIDKLEKIKLSEGVAKNKKLKEKCSICQKKYENIYKIELLS